MLRQVILVTGTPCVGKTMVANLLTSKCDGLNVNLNELAIREKLTSGRDVKRDSLMIDETRLRKKVLGLIKSSSERVVVIDGHYAVDIVPKEFVAWVFVLRRDPVELRMFMERRGFSGRKLWENLAAEILDVCLIEALDVYGEEKVCELNGSGKSVAELVDEIVDVLTGRQKCQVGRVDWLGKLEREGILEEYFKI